jgi:hypothetical protein
VDNRVIKYIFPGLGRDTKNSVSEEEMEAAPMGMD